MFHKVFYTEHNVGLRQAQAPVFKAHRKHGNAQNLVECLAVEEDTERVKTEKSC